MSIAACVKEVLLAASKNYWWLRQEQVAVHKKAIAGGAMPRQRAMPGWAKELRLAAPKSYCWRWLRQRAIAVCAKESITSYSRLRQRALAVCAKE